MNLVDMVKSQMSGDVVGKLSQLIGESETKTKAAVGAAVPALLAGLSNVASSPAGAQKLNSALQGFDLSALSNPGGMLSNLSGSMMEKGGGLLGSLFGGNILGGLSGALEKYTGLGSGTISKLLGMLLPMILGSLASKAPGGRLDAQGLSSMLADQKRNISDALPAGFSLNSIPGLGAASAMASSAAGAAQQAASGSPSWLLPLALLALVAAGAWWWFVGRAPTVPPLPAVPEATAVTKDLTGVFNTLTDSLASIKDAATADAALPKLTDVQAKLDGVKTMWDKLPAAGRSTVMEFLKSKLGALRELIDRVTQMPGVGDKVKPVTDSILAKLTALTT